MINIGTDNAFWDELIAGGLGATLIQKIVKDLAEAFPVLEKLKLYVAGLLSLALAWFILFAPPTVKAVSQLALTIMGSAAFFNAWYQSTKSAVTVNRADTVVSTAVEEPTAVTTPEDGEESL